MSTNIFMRNAKALLANKWQSAALGTLLFLIIQAIGLCILALLIGLINIPIPYGANNSFSLFAVAVLCIIIISAILGPLQAGYIYFLNKLAYSGIYDSNLLWSGFKNFKQNFSLYLIWYTTCVFLCIIYNILPKDTTFISVIILLIYFLLAYIVLIRLSLMFFINEILRNKNSVLEVIQYTLNISSKYDWKIICLNFRFLGWIILGSLSLGIGFIWITPYICVAYNELTKSIFIKKDFILNNWSFPKIFTILFIITFWTIMLAGAFNH